MRVNAEFVVAVSTLTAILAINAAYEIRRRGRCRRSARLAQDRAQLADAEQRLLREIRAAQRRALELTVAGEFAALGSDQFLARFLAIHPELRTAGQKGGTS